MPNELLVALAAAVEEYKRRTAETDEEIAERAGMKRPAMLRALRKGKTDEGTVELQTVQKIAAAIGYELRLEARGHRNDR